MEDHASINRRASRIKLLLMDCDGVLTDGRLWLLEDGCEIGHFHPRCPYAQPDHSRIDPSLEPVPDEPRHHVACLLAPEVRRRLWAELREGRMPDEALAAVGAAVEGA